MVWCMKTVPNSVYIGVSENLQLAEFILEGQVAAHPPAAGDLAGRYITRGQGSNGT